MDARRRRGRASVRARFASRKHDFLVREVHKAAGKFGRIFVRRNGTDMWMKDQYLDILFRWLYLPLYILFASFSLNF